MNNKEYNEAIKFYIYWKIDLKFLDVFNNKELLKDSLENKLFLKNKIYQEQYDRLKILYFISWIPLLPLKEFNKGKKNNVINWGYRGKVIVYNENWWK